MNEAGNFKEPGKASTRRLYFEDAYRREFESRVIEVRFHEGRPALILEATCFYPEGGGQPGDLGEIEGVKVVGVIEDQGEILHLLEEVVQAEKVKGKIDWARRYDFMQQHSGQHLLSQVFFELLGAETLSFHLGEETASIELDLAQLEEADVEKVERKTAEIIFENRPIKTYFIEEREISQIPFRKRPVKSGLIRVVEIDRFDYSACGGTHVRQTGEIGLIKIIGQEKIRKNVRVYFVCGYRALKDYQHKEKILARLATGLGTSINQLPLTVERLQLETRDLRKRCLKLREEMNQYEAEKIMAEAREIIIDRLFEDRTAEEARHLGLKIVHSGRFLVIFGIKGESRNHLLLARAAEIPLDLRKWLPWLKENFEARGGGSDSLIEMALPKSQNLEEIISELRKKIVPDIEAIIHNEGKQ